MFSFYNNTNLNENIRFDIDFGSEGQLIQKKLNKNIVMVMDISSINIRNMKCVSS